MTDVYLKVVSPNSFKNALTQLFAENPSFVRNPVQNGTIETTGEWFGRFDIAGSGDAKSYKYETSPGVFDSADYWLIRCSLEMFEALKATAKNNKIHGTEILGATNLPDPPYPGGIYLSPPDPLRLVWA